MAINFLNNIASIGALTITRATTDPLLYLYNTSNGSGSTIRFSDQTTPTQNGDITFYHSDGASQGGGASFHFASQPDTVLVVGSSINNGRFVSKSAGSAGEVDYGFYDDVDTGMYRSSANNASLVAGGVRGVDVSTTAVSLRHAGSVKLATTSGGVGVTGDVNTSGNADINGGNITINGSYPRFNLYSNDAGEDDWSLINDNGSIIFYNSTQGTYPFRLAETTGNATFAGTVTIPSYIYHTGDTNTFFGFNSSDQWKVTAGGNVGIQLQNSGVYLYYGGNEKLRTTSTGVLVEGEGIFTGNVGIGTTSPGTELSVNGAISAITSDYVQGTTGSRLLMHSAGTGNSHSYIQAQSSGGASNAEDLALQLYGGNVGIGTDSPIAKLHVYQNDTEVDTEAGVTIEQDGTGDAALSFLLTGTKRWRMGIDNNDSDKFKISDSTNLASNNKLTIDTSGNVGIGTTSPGQKLEVIGRTKITQSGDALRINSSDANGSYATWQNNESNIGYIGAGYHLWGSPNNIATSLGIRAQTRLDLGVQSSVHMTILNTGNVGIGTTSPKQKLHVSGGTTAGDVTKMVIGATNGNAESYLYLAESFSGDNVNYGFAFVADGNSSNNLLFKRHSNSTSGTTVMEIRRDSDQIRFNGYSGTNQTGTPTYILGTDASGNVVKVLGSNIPTAAPATPGSLVATIVGETIEIAFAQSSTSNIGYYQVWSSDDGGDYGLIAQVTPTDFSATMTVVDTTFVTGGTMSYRVFAVKNGVYSSPGTVSKAYTVGALSVTNMTVVNLNTAYYIQYEKPTTRFIDHIEIWMDSQTTSAALLRSNAVLVYSGQNASYMRNVNTSSNFHQFWVEIVTS